MRRSRIQGSGWYPEYWWILVFAAFLSLPPLAIWNMFLAIIEPEVNPGLLKRALGLAGLYLLALVGVVALGKLGMLLP